MISLSSLFPPAHVMRLTVADQSAAITELSRCAAQLLGVSAAAIAAALADREALGSTGVGAGLAVPHARVRGVPALAALFARLNRAVEWDAVDGRPVDLVFLLISPIGASAEHLAALAMVTRRLRDPAVAAALRATAQSAALREILVGRETVTETP